MHQCFVHYICIANWGDVYQVEYHGDHQTD